MDQKTPTPSFSNVRVSDEEIIIHPNAKKSGKTWTIETRIIGRMEIDGHKYEFNRVVRIKVKPWIPQS